MSLAAMLEQFDSVTFKKPSVDTHSEYLQQLIGNCSETTTEEEIQEEVVLSPEITKLDTVLLDVQAKYEEIKFKSNENLSFLETNNKTYKKNVANCEKLQKAIVASSFEQKIELLERKNQIMIDKISRMEKFILMRSGVRM